MSKRGMQASRSTALHLSDPKISKVPACGSRSDRVTHDLLQVTCRSCRELIGMPAGRPETGPMRFGEDWTGVFIRGDSAFAYVQALNQLLAAIADKQVNLGLQLVVIEDLLRLLESSDERRKAQAQQLKEFAECLR